MTRSTARREKRLACPGIADDDVRRTLTRFVIPCRAKRVEKRGHVRNLPAREREFRHPAIAPAVLDHRCDQLATLIVEQETGAQQAGNAVAAENVRAVAEQA